MSGVFNEGKWKEVIERNNQVIRADLPAEGLLVDGYVPWFVWGQAEYCPLDIRTGV